MANFLFTAATAGATVEIQVDRPPVLVAPAQVWLRAVNHSGLADFEESGTAYDGAHHEYYHEWTINGQPISEWTKPENLIAAHNNPNKAYGIEVGFLLPDAADYVIDLVVTDRNGDTAIASTSILTVVSPESYFPEADRIYVDPDGGFLSDGVPHTSRTATTVAELKAELLDAADDTIPWVLLRAGKTFDFESMVATYSGWMRVNSTSPFSMMSAYGAGAKPKIIPATDLSSNSSKSMFNFEGNVGNPAFITITGVRFEGDYDTATERGHSGNLSCLGWSSSQLQNSFVLLHDIEMDGLDKAFELGATGTSINNRMMIAACDITNWRNYGMLGGDQSFKYALVGNRVVQKVAALHGGDKGDALVNNHGPVRLVAGEYVYLAQNDLFSRTGWSPTGGSTERQNQPCLRLFVDPKPNQNGFVCNNVMEGGYQIINMEDASDGKDITYPGNVVIEKNIMLGAAKGAQSSFISCHRSGVTVRDNLFIMPNVPLAETAGYGGYALSFAMTSPLNAVAWNLTDPIVVYGNTYVNLMDSTNDKGGDWNFLKVSTASNSYVYENVIEENNVVHKPNMDSNPVTTFAPIDVSTAISGITPRFSGRRYGYDVATYTLPSNVANGASFTVPYAVLNKRLQNGTYVDGDTDATNRAYWEAIEAIDTRHALYVNTKRLFTELGHFSIDFDDTGAVITNTSGLTLSGSVKVHLDRTSLIPTMDASYASPPTIPLPRPMTGSLAIETATNGRVSPKDILFNERSGNPARGALEPT